MQSVDDVYYSYDVFEVLQRLVFANPVLHHNCTPVLYSRGHSSDKWRVNICHGTGTCGERYLHSRPFRLEGVIFNAVNVNHGDILVGDVIVITAFEEATGIVSNFFHSGRSS